MGHEGVTIENGGISTAGAGIALIDARRATIRNVDVGGQGGGFLLTGGFENRILDSSVRSLSQAIVLSGERGDVLRDDVSEYVEGGGDVELDNSFANRIVGGTFTQVYLDNSSLNLIARNTFTTAPFPPRQLRGHHWKRQLQPDRPQRRYGFDHAAGEGQRAAPQHDPAVANASMSGAS